MVRKLSNIFIVFMGLLLLTGCWDYLDIDKKLILTATAVDYENEKDVIAVEFSQLRKTKGEDGGTGGGSESAQPQETAIAVGRGGNFDEARAELDMKVPFPIFLGATRVNILGKGIAEKGIESYMNRIKGIFDYRRALLVVVSRETVTEILKSKPKNDISVGFMIDDIINQLRKTRTGVYITAGDVLSDIAMGKIGYVLPYIGKEGDNIKYLGLAVMKDSKFKGYFDIEGARGVVYIIADNPTITQVIPHPKNPKNLTSFETRVKKKRIRTDYVDGKVVIDIDIDLEARIVYQYYIEPINDEVRKMYEDAITKKVKGEILDAINRTQKEFEVDIYKFAKNFRADHPRIYNEIDWEKSYTDSEINVNLKTSIVGLGIVDPNAEKKY